MRHKTLFLVSAVLLLLTSCIKEVLPEGESKLGGNSMLTIKTRSGGQTEANDNANISYPVQIYVFDAEEGSCVTTAAISQNNQELAFNLKEGRYDVCAIAGADAESYELPTVANAEKTTVVTLKDGKQHTALMGATNSISLADGESNTLTLALRHKTFLLQEVTIKNVPAKVTAVAVEIAPLHAGLCLNGSYSTETTLQQMVLTRQEDGKTWTNTTETHLLQAGEEGTITVKMTNADGDGKVKSYSYTSADKLEANYKLKIEGTYTGNTGIALTGSITAEEWAGERTIAFEFDESGSTEVNDESGNNGDNGNGNSGDNGNDNPGNEPSTVINGKAPALSSNYNGAYVLQRTVNDNGTVTVVLLSPKMTFGLSFNPDDQTSVHAAIEAALPEVSVDGISGWRLPTYEEIKYASDNSSNINKTLKNITGAETLSNSVPYFYLKTSNNHVQIYEGGATKVPDTAGRLRAFATLVFSAE